MNWPANSRNKNKLWPSADWPKMCRQRENKVTFCPPSLCDVTFLLAGVSDLVPLKSSSNVADEKEKILEIGPLQGLVT